MRVYIVKDTEGTIYTVWDSFEGAMSFIEREFPDNMGMYVAEAAVMETAKKFPELFLEFE